MWRWTVSDLELVGHKERRRGRVDRFKNKDEQLITSHGRDGG
jgi:hypothetical protein